MQLNKQLIIVLIVVFNVLAIIVAVPAAFSDNSEYATLVQEAEEYFEKDLCEKAIVLYEQAQDIEDSLDLSIQIAKVYYRGLQNGEFSSYYQFSDLLFELIDNYRKEARAYEVAVQSLWDMQRYEDCVIALKQAEDFGIQTKTIDAIKNEMEFLCEENFSTYENVFFTHENTYLIKNEKYSFVNSTLGTLEGAKYDYATPMVNGYALVKSGKYTYLMSEDMVREAYFSSDITESTGVGDSLIACKIGETYSYYDLSGNKKFGEYLFAGRFANGVAPVSTDKGWQIIDIKGKPITDQYFEDVKLSPTHDCAQSGIIIAKTNGKYQLYDCKAKLIADVKLDDADVFLQEAELAACKIGEKWGFIDKKGKLIIDLQYDEAKSFSNGLAGVCKGNTWSFIEKTGKEVIVGEFEDVNYFNINGYCFVKKGNYWKYLSRYYY